MYLFHNTYDEKTLFKILKDGKLKAAYLTNNIREGSGIYLAKNQKFVFFSTVDKLKSKYKISAMIILYFDSELLFNRSYYVATHHCMYPPHTYEDKKNKKYNRKYPQYYTRTKSVLKRLYDRSVSLLKGRFFQTFQQVAIKKECTLKHLKQISFAKEPSPKLVKLIREKYPNVNIVMHKLS